MNAVIEAYSLMAAMSAVFVYGLAFIAFALDFATRIGRREKSAPAERSGGQLAAHEGVGRTVVVEREAPPAERPALGRFARVGLALGTLGLLVNVTAVVLRGVSGGGRVPWSNLYEFALTGVAIIVAVFLAVNLWQRIAYLGAYVTGFGLIALLAATVSFYVGPVPLPPALNSVWIVVHVLVAILGTAFFAIGAGLSVLQLIQAKRERDGSGWRNIPGAVALESLAYRINVVGFVLWTFTVVFGAIWAERAWGRYWGWDPKEVWSFVIWVIFASYIHARATRGWRGSRAAWLAIAGFIAVLLNYTVVNTVLQGLHSYSGL